MPKFIVMAMLFVTVANLQQQEEIDHQAVTNDLEINQLIPQEEDEIPVNPGREQNIF